MWSGGNFQGVRSWASLWMKPGKGNLYKRLKEPSTRQECRDQCALFVTLLVSPSTCPFWGCLLDEVEKGFSSFPFLQSQSILISPPLAAVNRHWEGLSVLVLLKSQRSLHLPHQPAGTLAAWHRHPWGSGETQASTQSWAGWVSHLCPKHCLGTSCVPGSMPKFESLGDSFS